MTYGGIGDGGVRKVAAITDWSSLPQVRGFTPSEGRILIDGQVSAMTDTSAMADASATTALADGRISDD